MCFVVPDFMRTMAAYTAKNVFKPAVEGLESFHDLERRTPVTIDRSLCTGCQLCILACPQSVLKPIPDPRRVEGIVATVFNPALCTACRQCEDICPDFCIVVTSEAL
ncbi:MAG: 4Fe-4S binding protein [Acidobacteria bacterium]|nr:4Fe-4S binding protein [Acidobacteriota bacterium]